MPRYLHKFETESEFECVYDGEDYIEPWVSLTMESDERVDYNKVVVPPEEVAFEAGNFVRLSVNWTGEEEHYEYYYHPLTIDLDFGPNFDYSYNSVFVASGDAAENFMRMLDASHVEFNMSPNPSFNEYTNSCTTTSKGYTTPGGYLNIKYRPVLSGEGTAYTCREGSNGWYAIWNGGLG